MYDVADYFQFIVMAGGKGVSLALMARSVFHVSKQASGGRYRWN